jgi:hypothetical protein
VRIDSGFPLVLGDGCAFYNYGFVVLNMFMTLALRRQMVLSDV